MIGQTKLCHVYFVTIIIDCCNIIANHSAPSVKISRFGFVILIASRHIIRSINILYGIRNYRIAFLINRFICMNSNAKLINIGNVVRFVNHGVEVQFVTIFHTCFQRLNDNRSYTFNIFLYIRIFSVCYSIIGIILDPALEYFAFIKVNMRIINIRIQLIISVLFGSYAHFSYLLCSIHEIDKQTSIRISFFCLHNGINRETISSKIKSRYRAIGCIECCRNFLCTVLAIMDQIQLCAFRHR